MKGYDYYIYLIFFCKLIMLLSSISYFILRKSGNHNHEIRSKIKNIRDTFEFMFIFLMALLMIYIFNPRYPVQINYETKLLFFLLGIILLLTAKYKIFFAESKDMIELEKLQDIFGN
jgi:hypothetical protein